MTIAHIIILLITGIAVGFVGGLLGLGGAFIMGPVQYLVYVNIGIPEEVAIKLALGTNLLVILPTAISGTWRHHRKGMVFWKAAFIMGSCSLISSFGGAAIATHLPGTVLRIAFGTTILVSGIRMLTSRLPQVEEEPKDNPWLWAAWALPVGVVSGLLGVGGGIVAIPVMTLALRFKMHNAIATSLAMMILTSTGGVIGYIINGIGVPDLPAYSIGYINLQSWFLLTVTSIGMVQVGAITAHHLAAKQVRYIFITIMLYMGLKMLGVFDWLGWPL
ncbi:sulfite exporter TauE/SafE family protein [Chloroflexota bacterium]